ncbi:hypothetical protein [Caudoviricetes sp.]|nr:hypothetical protein [Caudoviricetes sp.]
MVEIPSQRFLQQSSGSTALPYSNASATPEAFGAGVGQALQEASQQIDKSREQFIDYAKQDAKVQALHEYNNYSKEIRELETNYSLLNSSEAVAQWPKLQKDIEAIKQRASESSKGNYLVQQEIESLLMGRTNQALESGQTHFVKQKGVMAESAFNDSMKLTINDTGENYQNPKRASENLSFLYANIDSQAQIMGWQGPTVALKKQEAKDFNDTAFYGALFAKDPVKAYEEMQKDPSVSVKVRTNLSEQYKGDREEAEILERQQAMEAVIYNNDPVPDAVGMTDKQYSTTTTDLNKLPDNLPPRFKNMSIPADMKNMTVDSANKIGVNPNHSLVHFAMESGFNPKATGEVTPYMKEKGISSAKGIGQMVDSTARAYGLTGNDVYNPQKAIPASIKYQKTLLDRYKGNGLVAAVAYFTGEPIMDGLIRKHGMPNENGLSNEQWLNKIGVKNPNSKEYGQNYLMLMAVMEKRTGLSNGDINSTSANGGQAVPVQSSTPVTFAQKTISVLEKYDMAIRAIEDPQSPYYGKTLKERTQRREYETRRKADAEAMLFAKSEESYAVIYNEIQKGLSVPEAKQKLIQDWNNLRPEQIDKFEANDRTKTTYEQGQEDRTQTKETQSIALQVNKVKVDDTLTPEQKTTQINQVIRDSISQGDPKGNPLQVGAFISDAETESFQREQRTRTREAWARENDNRKAGSNLMASTKNYTDFSMFDPAKFAQDNPNADPDYIRTLTTFAQSNASNDTKNRFLSQNWNELTVESAQKFISDNKLKGDDAVAVMSTATSAENNRISRQRADEAYSRQQTQRIARSEFFQSFSDYPHQSIKEKINNLLNKYGDDIQEMIPELQDAGGRMKGGREKENSSIFLAKVAKDRAKGIYRDYDWYVANTVEGVVALGYGDTESNIKVQNYIEGRGDRMINDAERQSAKEGYAWYRANPMATVSELEAQPFFKNMNIAQSAALINQTEARDKERVLTLAYEMVSAGKSFDDFKTAGDFKNIRDGSFKWSLENTFKAKAESVNNEAVLALAVKGGITMSQLESSVAYSTATANGKIAARGIVKSNIETEKNKAQSDYIDSSLNYQLQTNINRGDFRYIGETFNLAMGNINAETASKSMAIKDRFSPEQGRTPSDQLQQAAFEKYLVDTGRKTVEMFETNPQDRFDELIQDPNIPIEDKRKSLSVAESGDSFKQNQVIAIQKQQEAEMLKQEKIKKEAEIKQTQQDKEKSKSNYNRELTLLYLDPSRALDPSLPYRADINLDDTNKLIEKQKQVRDSQDSKQDESRREVVSSFNMFWQMNMNGIPKQEDMDTSSGKRYSEALVAMVEEGNAFFEANQRPMNPKELLESVRLNTTKILTLDRIWPLPDTYSTLLKEVPSGARQSIANGLRQTGQPVTAQSIYDVYQKQQADLKK